MLIRPLLLCGAGLLALQLLTVHAEPPVIPADPPRGWSVSDSIGKQYRLGYDPQEKAYFIESVGTPEAAGKEINAQSLPLTGAGRVPYSDKGLHASDLWAASLLQSVKGAPYRSHKVKFIAEIKAMNFKGQFNLLLRAVSSDHQWTSSSSTSIDWQLDTPYDFHEWQAMSVEIDEIPAAMLDRFDPGSITYGFLIQGGGRVLMRNAQLVAEDAKPTTKTPIVKLPEVFGDPAAEEQPINLELHR